MKSLSFSSTLEDSRLFAPHFAGESWLPMKSTFKAIEGFRLTDKERELFLKLSGGIEPEQAKGIQQLFICKGRGSGGSRMLAAKGLHSCVFCNWIPFLSAGEIATALILATDQRQASETFGYVEGLVDAIPMIHSMIVRRTKQVIEFSNKTRIEVRVSNFRKVRGFSLCFAGLDEVAFWMDVDSGANPSKQVYQALLPALGRLPNSFLMAVSTPWSASGFFAEKIRKHYGKVA